MTKYIYEYTLEEVEHLLEQGPVVVRGGFLPVTIETRDGCYLICSKVAGVPIAVSGHTLVEALLLRCFGPHATIEQPTIDADSTHTAMLPMP